MAGAADVAAGPACRYDAALAADLSLAVTATCDGGVTGFAPPPPGIAPFIRDLAVGPGATARYRVDLAAAAEIRDSIDVAVRSGDAIIAAGSSWLLRPEGAAGITLEVRVESPAGLGFIAAAAGPDGVARYPADGLDYAGFAVFGRFEQVSIAVADGTTATLVALDGGLDIDRTVLIGWVAGRLDAANRFWRGPTTARPFVAVVPVAASGGVMFGLTRGGGGPGIALFIGEHTEISDLDNDWVLAHELVHAGMPFIPGAPWFMEGLAVYLEPLIRARAGLLTEDALWRGFATSLDRGTTVLATGPIGDAGFPDLYWGGAVMMLLADVVARTRSDGRFGIEDCLVAVHDRVGDAARTTAVDDVLKTCDRILGAAVGASIGRHRVAGSPVDLAQLWRDLGITVTDNGIRFDDSALLAWVRHAIMAGGAP